jgi:hypothetical protein
VGEGMTIVSGEQSGKLFSWNLSPEYLRKLISSSLRTGLSPQEWQLFLGTEFEYNPIAPAEITSPLVTATAPSVALPKDSPPIASQQALELPQDTGDKSRDKDPTDMIRYLPMPEGAGYSVAVDHDVLRYSGTGDCKMVVIELGWNQSSESLNMDILESKEGSWGADMTVPEKAFHTGVQLAAWASCVDAESLETWIYEPVIQYEVIDDQGTLRRLPDRYLAEDRQTVQ